MKVWALFSVDLQQYNQPENNLETLFLNKPSLDQLSKAIYGRPLVGKNEETLAMISLYRHGTPWAKLEAKKWLQKVMEGLG